MYINMDKRCQQYATEKVHNETNQRIYDRNIPSQMLQPYLDARAVSTKYSLLPIVDPRKELSVPMTQMPIYNSQKVFNPGNSQSPWSGFASSVNVESELRNQIYALQKCSQSVYVPDSKSDLYQSSFRPQKSVHQPFQELFKREQFSEFNPNVENIGQGLFLNSTRTQIKDLPNNSCNF